MPVPSARGGPVDVSVITPTFRRERELAEAIQSVLQQEGVNVEMLVIDDSPEQSARATVAALADPRIRYMTSAMPSNGRPAVPRNQALAAASGRYIYCLDDDDHVFPGALQAVVTALDATPRAGVAFGRVECFGPDLAILRHYRSWFDWAARTASRVSASSWLTTGVILFRGTLIINSTCAIRRSLALQLGGYDPEIPYYEDVEFYLRGIREFGHVFIDRPILHYRTGRPSLIHNLKSNTAPIAESHRLIHRKYKKRHGLAEYRTLQIASRLLPLEPHPEHHQPQ